MWPTEPQRHRDTEKAQSPSQTRRRKDTKASQSHPLTRFLTQRTGRKNLSRDDVLAAERRPRTAGPDTRSERKRSSRCSGPAACALGERRPRHFSPLFNSWEGHTSFPDRRETRRNRRVPGASAGGKHGCDERLRSEQSGFLPAGGDRQIADWFAVNLRHCRITSATISLRLCVFAPSRFIRSVDGSAPLRLCASTFLSSVFLLCVSVSLWFAGAPFPRTA